MKKLLLALALLYGGYSFADTAIFAGGCFWCMQADFDKLKGVTKTEAGYDGGTAKNPTYNLVSSGTSGYSEAVRVTYDPKQVSYSQLLDYYWHHIDPTNNKGQFCDNGPEYRSKIFYVSPAQQKEAEQSLENIKKSLKTVYTEIVPTTMFYPAEEPHQDYYKKNPNKYKFYRWNCGRDQRVKEVWQNEKLN